MGDGSPQILMVEIPFTIGERYEPLLVSAWTTIGQRTKL